MKAREGDVPARVAVTMVTMDDRDRRLPVVKSRYPVVKVTYPVVKAHVAVVPTRLHDGKLTLHDLQPRIAVVPLTIHDVLASIAAVPASKHDRPVRLHVVPAASQVTRAPREPCASRATHRDPYVAEIRGKRRAARGMPQGPPPCRDHSSSSR